MSIFYNVIILPNSHIITPLFTARWYAERGIAVAMT